MRAFDVADRQAAVDVQHDPAPGRIRQRHVGERLVGGQRQHRRVDADHRRRGARAGLSAGRDADVRLLRRPSSGQQPVRREPRRASTCAPGSGSGTTSSCIIRCGTTTCRRRRCWPTSPSTAARSRRSRCRASRASCACSIASPASRCGRSRSGRCRSRTCPARSRARRSRSRPGRRPTRATC